jgi:hypothetical protein
MASQISPAKQVRDWAAQSGSTALPADNNAPAVVLREIAAVLATVLALVAAIDVALTAFGIR